jgi:hypothetical protein
MEKLVQVFTRWHRTTLLNTSHQQITYNKITTDLQNIEDRRTSLFITLQTMHIDHGQDFRNIDFED